MLEHFREWLSRVDMMKTFVGISIITLFFILSIMLTKYEVPDKNKEVIIQLIGNITGAVMAIVGFYFGTSRSAQRKDDIIKSQADSIPNAPK